MHSLGFLMYACWALASLLAILLCALASCVHILFLFAELLLRRLNEIEVVVVMKNLRLLIIVLR